MKKLSLVAAVMALLLLPTLVLFATGGAEAVPAKQPVAVNLRIGVNPVTLDPTLVYTSDVNIIERMLFVSLVDFDEEKAMPAPDLATSWEVSPDGRIWTFKLRKDVKWTNGRAVTARDVEYSIKRIINPAVGSPLANKLYGVKNAKAVNTGELKDLNAVGVKALDDYTVQFELIDPIAFFASQVRVVGFPVPKETVEQYGDRWFEPSNIVSNGPYLLKEWTPNDKFVFEKNPSYYDAKNVQIEKVTMYVVEDDSTAMAMYEAGELDTVNVPSGDIDRVMKHPVLSKQAKSVGQLIAYMIQINTTFPPFDKPAVRKAFAAAIDKQALVKNIAKAGQVPMNTLTPLGCFGAVDPSEGVGIPFDPARAKQYLAEAGYPGGKGLPPIEFNFNTSEFNRNVAEVIQQMWKQNLGLDIPVKNIEGKVYWDTIVAGKLPYWRMGYAAEVPDAHSFLYEIAHTQYGEKNLRWNRKDFDEAVEKAMVELDPAKRKALYKRAETILCQEEAAIIPLWSYAYVAVTKPYLKRQYSRMMIDSVKNWRVEK